jgi:hypothetical protein
MSVIPNQPQEFWQPPAAAALAGVSPMAEACTSCATEFMVGAKFCHACGADRPQQPRFTEDAWTHWFEFLKVLEFQRLREALGLPAPSLVAFFAGLGCILAAIAVGLIYSAQSVADFQAIQLWRIQWLMGAAVAFAAGILLKKAGSAKS